MTSITDEKRAYNRAYYRKHRNEILAQHRTLEAREKNRLRQARLRRHRPKIYIDYKLRLQEGEAHRPKPNRCEVCGATDRPIHFDHCHQRGVFRGWLCTHCNSVLGFVNDDPNRLRMLIAYLERTKDFIAPQLTLPL